MPLRPTRRATLGALLHAQEAVGVQPERASAEITQRVQRVTNDQAHPRERRIQPIDRRLTVLEIVQVDPTPLDPIRAGDRRGRAPVGVFGPRVVKDHALQFADDVAGPLQPALGLAVEVDRVLAGQHLGQQLPVLGGISTMW
jgi:hypothetical protein